MKKENVIEINVPDKLIYGLFIFAIFVFGVVSVSAVSPNIMGHPASEVNGICNSTGGSCYFLNNYYNKTQVYNKKEFDGEIASITGCDWDGWNFQECNCCPNPFNQSECIPIGSYVDGRPGHDERVLCTADYVTMTECTNNVVTGTKNAYTACKVIIEAY